MNMTIFILLVASLCCSGVATAGSPESAPLPAHAAPQPGLEVDHAARRMPRSAVSISATAFTAAEVSSAGTTPGTTTSETTNGLTPDITSTYATPQTNPPGSASVPPTTVAGSTTPIPPSSSTLASTATTSELASPATTPETSSTDAVLQTTTTSTSTTTTTTFISQGHTTGGTTSETSTTKTTSGTTPELAPGASTTDINTEPSPAASTTSTSPGTSTKLTPTTSTTDISTENNTESTLGYSTTSTSPGYSTTSTSPGTSTKLTPTASTTSTSPGTSTEPTPTASTTDISTENSTEPAPALSTTSTSPRTSTESTPTASTTSTSPGTSTESTTTASTTDISTENSTESTPGYNTTSTSPATSTKSTPTASTTNTSPGTSTESTPTASTTDISTENSTESTQGYSTTSTSPGTSTESTSTASTTDITTENSTESTQGYSKTNTSPGTSTESTPTASTTDISTENSTESTQGYSTTNTSPGTSTESTPTASTTDISTENSTESTQGYSTTSTSPGTSTESTSTASTTDITTKNSTESTPTASTTDITTENSTESTPAAISTDTSSGTSTDTSSETSTESTTAASSTDTSSETSTESITAASSTDTSSETSTPESSPTTTVSVSPTITSFPPTCSVDLVNTTIEAQITLPRTLVVAWGNAAPSTVTVCLQEDCRITTESSVQFDEVTVGLPLLVSVTGTGFYDCVELFVPWQFRVGVAAHSLTLDWVNFSPRVLNVCLAMDMGHFPSYSSWIDCIETTNSSAWFSGLEPDTPFWVRVGEATVFHATTPPVAKYRSLAFRCHEPGACASGECRPASDGLLLALDWASPVPASYPYVCVNKDNAQSSPATTLAASNGIAVTSVVFASGGLEQDIDECLHTTALAVVKYWCDGMVNCSVEYSLLHSHLAVAEGCVDTRLDQYSLHMVYEDVVLSEPACRVGTSLFDPHKTCYDVGNSPDLLARRRSCMEAGGDIAFYDSDPAFLQFLNEFFGLSKEGLIVQGIIGDDVRPREPQLYAEDVDIYHINFDIHYTMSHQSFASDVPILCAYPPLVGVPDRLETATIAVDPCWSSPCLNGGTCFNATLDLNAAAASGDDFMCLCGGDYSGNLCENADTGIKDEAQDPVDGVYSFSAPPGEALGFEFVFFGRVWEGSCYAPAALALFRLKCDGQSQCQVSYKDLHHHLHSSCHPAVTPTLLVRYATYEYPESWSCGAESPVEGACLGTSPDQFLSAQDAKLYCAGMGGDLASMEDPTPSLCLNNASSLWVDNSTDFYAHPHYALTPGNPTSISCDGQTLQRHTALCVFPFVFSDSNSSTTISTTEESTTISTTEESTTISTTEESTTISTTEETTPKINTTASTTSTTTTTTPAPPGPCPETRPFPSAYPDYVWKQEEPGTLASKDCPKPKNVTVFWFCEANGKWKGLPDLSLCSTIDSGHWEDEIKNSTENAGDSLNNFLNVTESQELEPGDVTGTLNILGAARERHIEDLKNMNESEVLNATDVYTDAVTKTTNKMLQQPEVWFGLPDDARANASTALQEEVEAAAVEVAYLLVNESRNYETETVSISAKRHSKEHFERTENRIFYHKDRTETMLELPENFFVDMDDDLVAVSFTSYSTLHCVLGKSIICEPEDLPEASPDEASDTFPLPELVNTPVMGLTIGNASWNFSDGTGVKATFRDYFGSDIYNLSTATCVSWNVANEQWSPDGCELAFQTGTATVCTCSHLTNLAVIVDINGVFGKSPFLQWFTVVGCSISLVCLVLAIATLSLLLHKRRRNKTTTIIHLHLCCCLFVAELILLVGLDRTEDEVGCGVVAGFLHYFLLATFCWMGVEGVNVYFLVVKVFLTARSPLRYYTVVAYTAPALVVAVSAAVDSEGYGTEDYCWLSTENGLIWAFTGPALVILLVNFVMFGFGVRAYLSTNSSTGVRGGGGGRGNAEGTSKGEKRRLLRGSVILSSVLGLTWILGYFMMFGGSAAYAMAVLFTVVNSLHGAVLFVVMVLMNPTARTQLKLVLCCGCKKGLTNFPSSFTRSSRLDPSESFRKALESSSPDIPRQVPINPRGSGELDMWVAQEMKSRPGRRR